MKHAPDYIRQFIVDNQRVFTQKEMAKELGVSSVRISVLCKELGVKLITQSDRNKEYILAHPEMTKKELSEYFGCSIHHIYEYENELDIKIPTKRITDKVAKDQKIKTKKEPAKVLEGAELDYYIEKNRPGFLKVAAQMVETMTPEEKEKFGNAYVVNQRRFISENDY